MGNFEEAFILNDSALYLSEKTGNGELSAECYNSLFTLHFKKGAYQQALSAAEKALVIATEANSIQSLAQATDNIGIIKGINGLHTEAIEYFLQALKYFEKTGDQSKAGIALMHVGHTFELAGNYTKALEYLNRSLEISRQTGNSYNEGWALVNIGVVHSRLNQPETALSFYKRSLEIAEQINDLRLILTNLDNIGGKYSLKKDFDSANIYLQKAYRLSEAAGVNSRSVYIAGNLAENYLYMGRFDSARIFGEKQLELALHSGLISEQKVAYYVLAQIYDSLHDYTNANKALRNYIAVNDTIFSREKSMQIEELREKFEAEKKEQTIATLEKEKKTERFRRNTLAGIALLVLISGSLLYNNQRMKTRRNKEILEKEKQIDQMKSKFLTNITHEFRTPLTLILGPIEMMKAETASPKIHRQLDIMKINASRLLDLINQLLDLSKLESGSYKLAAAYGNIVPVVNGVVMSFESMAQAKGIELSTRSSEEQIYAYYDQRQLEKVIVNVVSNAIKFTPEHGTIQVELFKSDGLLHIIIRDNGRGIPPHELEHVFDRFYQADISDDATGTGIGLALARELIGLHHGSIHANSETGKGTEFIIKLPLGRAHLSDEEIVESNVLEGEPISISNSYPDHNFMSKNIPGGKGAEDKPMLLLIEDNADVRNYITDILRQTFQVLPAQNGEEGIQTAIEKTPDIVISDVMMPKMNGYMVCAALKQNEKTSHIPVILLTAKSAADDKIQGLENQADDYVIKPFVPGELLARVQNLINSRRRLRSKYQRELILKPSEVAVNSVDERFIQRLLKIMEENIGDERFGVEQLAAEVGMSRSQIHRKMIALTNNTPSHFIRIFRLTRAMELLKKQAATASEIAYMVGFNSPSYFTKCFREEFGYPPGEANPRSMNDEKI